MLNEFYFDEEKRKNEIAAIAATVMVLLGVTSAELSYSKCVHEFGEWFSEAVRKGKILPVREGKRNHRWFSVIDIFALKRSECDFLNKLQ